MFSASACSSHWLRRAPMASSPCLTERPDIPLCPTLAPRAAGAARPGRRTRPSPQGAWVAQLQPAGADMPALVLAARPGQAEWEGGRVLATPGFHGTWPPLELGAPPSRSATAATASWTRARNAMTVYPLARRSVLPLFPILAAMPSAKLHSTTCVLFRGSLASIRLCVATEY